MGISNVFEIGASGLLTQQDAMQTTSNNISNVNTPGYSRQRPVLQARAPELNFGHRVGGGGVELLTNIRVHDEFVQRQVVEEARNLGQLRAKSESLHRIEGIAHRGFTDLNERVHEFFANFRELSVNPEISALKVAVKESAVNLADGFRKTAESLENIRVQLDLQVETTVDRVNLLARELADLNARISSVPPNRQPPNELLDRRDGVVKSLAESLGVSVSTDAQGLMNIIIPGVGVLVHGGDANSLQMSRGAPESAEQNGEINIFLKTGTGFQYATKALPEGELGGLLDVRERTLNKTIAALDKVAFEFADAVNTIHRESASPEWDSTSVGNFFEELDGANGAALRVSVDEALKRDPSRIAAGFDREAPSDNRVALAIAGLQDSQIVSSGESSVKINDAINGIVSGIASETHGSSQIFNHQREIVEQLENYQKSVSGVSLEEEAVNMMQFQAAFNAAAKTIQVGDEMLETILSLKD